MFVNAREFSDPTHHQRALGVDTNPQNAIVAPNGQVLVHAQTGGMISPLRHELHPGTLLYRFATGKSSLNRGITGAWWVAKPEFEKMSHFAQEHKLHVAMAARLLCCVPPEWSDMGLLMRARVGRPLLAYRGLGNNVVIPKNDGLGAVRMQAHNNLASRRLHQLYIPGLYESAQKSQDQVIPGALKLEETWKLNPADTHRGWLYV